MSDISYINLQSPLTVKVEWKRTSAEPPLTLSISALMLNKESNKVEKIEDFVFYGSKTKGNKIVSIDDAVVSDLLDFENGFQLDGKHI